MLDRVLQSLKVFPQVMGGSGAFRVLGVCCQPCLLLPHEAEMLDPLLVGGPRDSLGS